MAMPTSIEARLFYRSALNRHDDAVVLLSADHTTGAVYLVGYGIECILKALILEGLAPDARKGMLAAFRGARAHDFGWLRTQYLQNGGARFPREITQAFTLVNDWTTDMRYEPKTIRVGDAEGFFAAAERIIHWAKERI